MLSNQNTGHVELKVVSLLLVLFSSRETILQVFAQVWAAAAGDPPAEDGEGRHGGGSLLQGDRRRDQHQEHHPGPLQVRQAAASLGRSVIESTLGP